MKQVVCLKPCSIGGKRFTVNDIVPQANVAPSRFKHLIDIGLIAVVDLPEPVQQQPAPTASSRSRKAAKKE